MFGLYVFQAGTEAGNNGVHRLKWWMTKAREIDGVMHIERVVGHWTT